VIGVFFFFFLNVVCVLNNKKLIVWCIFSYIVDLFLWLCFGRFVLTEPVI